MQQKVRAAENNPIVPMNSSTGMPLRTWIFLKAASAFSPGRAPFGGACANATPSCSKPSKEAKKAPAVTKTNSFFFKTLPDGMNLVECP